MQFFLDTADVEEIRYFSRMGIIDGVTTNPALIAKEGRNFKEVVEEICGIIDGPVSAEVVSTAANRMISEAKQISHLHPNIVVKLPAIPAGFEALNTVCQQGIKVNMTIIYTANQALIAAKAGATYVSPFVGRLDATSSSGIDLVKEIVAIFQNYCFKTKVLAASMRNPIYVKESALAGAHVATIPPDVLRQMLECELTDLGLKGFLSAWEELPEDKRAYFK